MDKITLINKQDITEYQRQWNFNEAIRQIENKAMGIPIIFEAEPTNSTMKANTWGYWNDEIYIKFSNGLCFKVALTPIS